MRFFTSLKLLVLLLAPVLVTGCAARKDYDYTAFRQHQPRSILVLPPQNNSPDVAASINMLSQATYPLAEAGYYVIPVALVSETLRQNGVMTEGDAHSLPLDKLEKIFGANAVLYITVTQSGTSYVVVDSATVVAANAKLVDLKTGETLWAGEARASSSENKNNTGGLLGMMVSALISQMLTDEDSASHTMAGVTSYRLLSAGQPGGLLYGPRSPKFGTD